jgi:hypothetical protein
MQAEVASQPEVARPKTPTERAADFYYDLHVQREAKKKADEQAKVAARQKRDTDEKAERERKVRQAQIQFQEAAVLREASDLTPDEVQGFWTRLAAMGKLLDAGAAAIVAESIRCERKD